MEPEKTAALKETAALSGVPETMLQTVFSYWGFSKTPNGNEKKQQIH